MEVWASKKRRSNFRSRSFRWRYRLAAFAGSEFLGAKSSLDRVPSATMDGFDGRLAQRLERPAYTGKVRGSNP